MHLSTPAYTDHLAKIYWRKEVRGMGSVRHEKKKSERNQRQGGTTRLQIIYLPSLPLPCYSPSWSVYVDGVFLHRVKILCSPWEELGNRRTFTKPMANLCTNSVQIASLGNWHLIEASNCVLACWHNYCTYTWYLPRAWQRTWYEIGD